MAYFFHITDLCIDIAEIIRREKSNILEILLRSAEPMKTCSLSNHIQANYAVLFSRDWRNISSYVLPF